MENLTGLTGPLPRVSSKKSGALFPVARANAFIKKIVGLHRYILFRVFAVMTYY